VKKNITNVSASVRALLLNLAKRQERPYNEILQYYGMERFLYRLSRSPYSDLFVLKGALMLQIWGPSLTRSTKDVDLLGKTEHSVDNTLDIMRKCLLLEVPDDGVRFDADSIKGSENPVKQSQWQAFRRKSRLATDLPAIHEVFLVLRGFLLPPMSAAASGRPLTMKWFDGGPWRSAEEHRPVALPR
jgi:hypothetical protein